jgi:aspartyl-tRNA(Asn)/glutamyl-tRNA(Gln) amidotransferase subunit A
MNIDEISRRHFLIASAGVAAASAVRPVAAIGDLTSLSLREASDLLRHRTVSSVDLTTACLQRIRRLNPHLNAFITVTDEAALATAHAMDAELQHGKIRGPLHGIPIALKDNIDTAGVRTTAASQLFKDRIPTEDAEVVRSLKNAGAVILGKLNLHEFAYGGTSAVSYFGPVHNPWALDRVPGGSSGGSAAAVCAGLCFGALGTDTAGSVRIPASCCGVVGLKATYGRVSNRGVIPLSWSHDHVGTLTRTVEDAALMVGVFAGYDAADPSTRDVPVDAYHERVRMPVSKLRIGIARASFFDSVDPRMAQAVETALAVLTKLTGRVVDVSLPPGGYRSSGVYANVRGPEAFAYHAAFLAQSPDKYQTPTRAALQASAETKIDAYVRARRDVDLLRREIVRTFSQVDLVVTPTMIGEPVLIAESARDNAVDWRNTVPFNTYGVPAISIPCGVTAGGLPVGLQIAGPPFGESTMLALAHAYERATDWHTLRPALDA